MNKKNIIDKYIFYDKKSLYKAKKLHFSRES
jgi:hypothetical protein